MKVSFSIVLLLVFVVADYTQSQAVLKSEYDAVFGNAVQVTNAAFPFVFTVITNTYENGKVVSTLTEIAERQAQGIERETKTLRRDGKTVRTYEIMVGFGNNTYCSLDGKTWIGPQQNICHGPNDSGMIRLYGPRRPESVEYSVTTKSLKGQQVKVYREYAIFTSSEPSGKKDFQEEISTVDANGFFLEILGTEGTLAPRTVTLTRKQTWKLNVKFTPVKAP